VAGFLAGRLVWLLLRPTFEQPLFQRENVAGREVPVAAGIVLPLALLVVESGRALAAAAGLGGDRFLTTDARVGVVAAVVGFAFLGLLDDLAGEYGDSRGFRGHVAALVGGRMTTGAVKMIGGIAVALWASGVVDVADKVGAGRLVMDGAVVALAANLGNLLDRAPGRAGKFGLLSFGALAIATLLPPELAGVAVVAGALGALFLDDLHERLMLGDAGANAFGGAMGLGVVLAGGATLRLVVLVVLGVLNLLSEFVSFSRVINAVPALRAFDRAGRLRS
jgi:UDP-N-acetylmuramyl pentapeptide phosphotransferase/UDP-N-acetylglucosamine-1-phosphate transferase